MTSLTACAAVNRPMDTIIYHAPLDKSIKIIDNRAFTATA